MAGAMSEGSGGNVDSNVIRVRGARVHNLKGIDVDIPRDRLVVLTGVSGSGKSSLAFDTLYAEGQRRYIESLSSYARQFLDQLERPDVDAIEGLPPTVSVDQNRGTTNPRSTVATITEIHDYLRILFARTGTPHCPRCGQAIHRQTPEEMVATVLAMREGRKVLILSPLVRGKKGVHLEAFAAVRRAGLLRVRVDGEVVEVSKDDPKLAKTKIHHVEAVVDRLVVREGIRPRLSESIDLALKLGEGTILLSVETESGWDDLVLSLHFACPGCGFGLGEMEPRVFSFNSPYGACPACGGLGKVTRFDPELVVPDRGLSLEQGAVAPWRENREEARWVKPFLKNHKLNCTTPLSVWGKSDFDIFLHGGKGGAEAIGVIPDLERVYKGVKGGLRKRVLEHYRTGAECGECGGSRLRAEARGVTLAGKSLPAVSEMPIGSCRGFFEGVAFPAGLEKVGPPLVREIVARLRFLERVGLEYLTLGRGSDTLSGGELQRVRLASQIGSGLVGVCYLLDEPTAGLHPADTDALLESLAELRDQGNSVILVEHDEASIRAADWVIDLGPGAGPEGGRVVAMGRPDSLITIGESSTAAYLRKEWSIASSGPERLSRSPGWLKLINATERNLKGVEVAIPLGALTCVTGVSGSGKSTLVHEILARGVKRLLDANMKSKDPHGEIIGGEAIDKLVVIDQSAIGRGPRSTPATYTGVFDEIRRVFARTREAKIRGYGSRRFSFNVKGGRCERCEGQGVRKIEMKFLPDMYVRCELCGGKRFNRQTLEVKFKGKSIGDVLAMRVDESLELFDAQPKIRPWLVALAEAGLGYVTLGQSSSTLSGGEAQRVKLAGELGRVATGRTLYILDEPTTGLHFSDVTRLLHVLNRLAELGNTLVVIEHNVDVIKAADWVIDLGPGGGERGGRVVAMGAPREVAEVDASLTGRYLRRPLGLD